jgi:hypothetical protein
VRRRFFLGRDDSPEGWCVLRRRKGIFIDDYARGGQSIRDLTPTMVRGGLSRAGARELASRLNDGSVSAESLERESEMRCAPRTGGLGTESVLEQEEDDA